MLLTQHVQSAPIGGLPVFMKAALHDVAQNVNETVAKAKKILQLPAMRSPSAPWRWRSVSPISVSFEMSYFITIETSILVLVRLAASQGMASIRIVRYAQEILLVLSVAMGCAG